MATCFERLENMKKIGFNPEVIFDCGAFYGHWTLKVHNLYNEAKYVLFEPNTTIINNTKKTISEIKLPKPIIFKYAVGEKEEKSFLNIWNNEQTSMAGSSMLAHVQGVPLKKLEISIITLDKIAKKYKLKPNLIKLDLQGGEVSALKGAK